ncbi:MAG: acetate kinase [Ruminococcaceae bacterium]|nr:acetate kinase [Oscillospiraceae bacterium]
MNVLVVNAGSSSLKYQLFDTTTNDVLAKGICERIGIDGKIEHKINGEKYTEEIDMPNHAVATSVVVRYLTDAKVGCIKSMDEIEAVGHRVVHGGEYFSESVLLTDEVLAKLELCRDLAPLHTPAHIMGIQGCLEAMPGKPQVLVFDTAFHQTMPEEAYMYGLPYEMYEKHHIRRYGAHGTSHRYVAAEAAKLLDKPVEETKIVTCHIGNGSSISAVKGGKCIDTSMGFTPLAGVLMGTRCGSIDPAIVTYIMKHEGFTPDEMSDYMNKKCGFLGLSGISSDSRDIEAAILQGNKRAKIAAETLAYQIKKYIGSYTAAMDGLDAVIFTAGMGENNPELRERACSNLENFGIKLDKEVNAKGHHQSEALLLSTPDSKVKVYLIPTNEELVIASDTERLVKAL